MGVVARNVLLGQNRCATLIRKMILGTFSWFWQITLMKTNEILVKNKMIPIDWQIENI